MGQQDVTVALFAEPLEKGCLLAAGPSPAVSMAAPGQVAKSVGWFDGSLSEESTQDSESSVSVSYGSARMLRGLMENRSGLDQRTRLPNGGAKEHW